MKTQENNINKNCGLLQASLIKTHQLQIQPTCIKQIYNTMNTILKHLKSPEHGLGSIKHGENLNYP